ncbi:MAG: DNA polymerase III subunit delta' [Desulfobacteraceae bacterium]|nr:DNA polymerase III subunit delta' [Desulfobacteraceae bacterium]
MSDFDQKTAISQTISELNCIIKADKIPNALLFFGDKNTGKKETAFEFAKTCNCKADVKRPCNICPSCKKIDTGMHPDIIKICLPEKKKMISISQIREIGLLISVKPNEALKRMVLIMDSDKMNIQAQNALLKVLEEPPKNTFFILTATQIPPLLPTIISRCRQVRFSTPSCHEIQQTIINQYKIDPQKAYIAVRTADSDLEKALTLLNLNLDKNEEGKVDWQKQRIWIIKEIIGLISTSSGTNIQKALMLSQKLSMAPDNIFDAITIIKMVLRDLCIFKYSPEKIVNLDFFDAFKDISQMHAYNKFLEWIKDLHETEKRLRSNSSIRLTLDRFFLKLSIL